jgi:hypothetical protein
MSRFVRAGSLTFGAAARFRAVFRGVIFFARAVSARVFVDFFFAAMSTPLSPPFVIG